MSEVQDGVDEDDEDDEVESSYNATGHIPSLSTRWDSIYNQGCLSR